MDNEPGERETFVAPNSRIFSLTGDYIVYRSSPGAALCLSSTGGHGEHRSVRSLLGPHRSRSMQKCCVKHDEQRLYILCSLRERQRLQGQVLVEGIR
jgi:hypothetical protein